jgi:hypothetical protein
MSPGLYELAIVGGLVLGHGAAWGLKSALRRVTVPRGRHQTVRAGGAK